jgi:hypothetical protein
VAWYFGSQSAEQAKQFFGMVHQAFPTRTPRSTMAGAESQRHGDSCWTCLAERVVDE